MLATISSQKITFMYIKNICEWLWGTKKKTLYKVVEGMYELPGAACDFLRPEPTAS